MGFRSRMSLASRFEQIFGQLPRVEACAPGRVNLLGEHVDYNQGVVLPIAIDRAVTLVAAATSDAKVTLSALDLGEQVSFELSNIDKKCDLSSDPLPGWA